VGTVRELHTYLSVWMSICRAVCLSTFLRVVCLRVCLLASYCTSQNAYLLSCAPIYLPTSMHAYLSGCPLLCLPTLPAFLSLPAFFYLLTLPETGSPHSARSFFKPIVAAEAVVGMLFIPTHRLGYTSPGVPFTSKMILKCNVCNVSRVY
jgi:hypothetical protein